jgi:hypothetical protein
MVVFGAGSSYDSISSRRPELAASQHRPPLANELFADRQIFGDALRQFPECLPIIPYLQNIPEGSNVERELERLQGEAATTPQRYPQLAAIRFYLHQIISVAANNWAAAGYGVTNFKTLLDQFLQWQVQRAEPIALVTFNYDTLLEDAMLAAGLRLNNLSDFVDGDTFKLIKVHGSVSWVREVNAAVENIGGRQWPDLAKELISRAAQLEMTRSYHLVGSAPPVRVGDHAAFPALAIPFENKPDFECPDEHMQVLRDSLSKVTELIVIGWRATDRPFLDLMRESQKMPRILIVDRGNGAGEVRGRLEAAGIQGHFSESTSGFSNFVVRREADAFLRGG